MLPEYPLQATLPSSQSFASTRPRRLVLRDIDSSTHILRSSALLPPGCCLGLGAHLSNPQLQPLFRFPLELSCLHLARCHPHAFPASVGQPQQFLTAGYALVLWLPLSLSLSTPAFSLLYSLAPPHQASHWPLPSLQSTSSLDSPPRTD
jgi:hypothetical protein